eukprot:4081218-Ditylum_brightwellii.AAC.1
MGNTDTAPIPEDEESQQNAFAEESTSDDYVDNERGTAEPTIGDDGASIDEADATDVLTAEDEDSQHYFITRNATAKIGSLEDNETGTTKPTIRCGRPKRK